MNTVIKPGDRVKVVTKNRAYKGYVYDLYNAEVVEWTPSGLIKIKPDGKKGTKNVSADNVKKIKDAR